MRAEFRDTIGGLQIVMQVETNEEGLLLRQFCKDARSHGIRIYGSGMEGGRQGYRNMNFGPEYPGEEDVEEAEDGPGPV